MATIAVSGELDIATAPRLEATVSHDGLGAAETVVLDLGGVTFIDSTGLRAVLLLHAEVGPRLRIVPSDACRRVMAIAGVTGSLPLENGDEPA